MDSCAFKRQLVDLEHLMKLKEIYASAIETGIRNDPRGKASVQKELKELEKNYRKKSSGEKEYFDAERLKNPYSDTRILYGDPETEVASVLIGIDIDTSELLLADWLRKNGKPVDLVISHHPSGRALAGLHDVMSMQAEIFGNFGVPINIAESLMEKRVGDVEKRLLAANHTKTVDAAKLLDIPFMCIHTPADNCVVHFLQELFDKKKPGKLSDVLKLLKTIPEYKLAAEGGRPPKVVNGNPNRRCGNIMVDMTGGTEGPDKLFKSMAVAGINTLVGMHYSTEHLKTAADEHLNIVVAGHISSDVLGLNLLFDTIFKNKAMTVYECSGFNRISRIKDVPRS